MTNQSNRAFTRVLYLVALMSMAGSALAGTVITTNLPAGTSIVNINGAQDGTASYNGDQSLFYSPFSTQGSASLLTLPVAAGAYTFSIVDPTDAATLFPALTQTQLASLYTAWTYNSPWTTDYMVFDISAATDSSVPQLFDGAPDPTGFSDAQSAYNDAIANGYANKIRAGATGRDGTVLTSSYTFAAATTLVFAVPDSGLYDNAGGVSVVVAPAATQPTVAITSPPPDATLVLGGTLPLAASVTNPAGLAASVQFEIDGVPINGPLSAAPYVTSTPLSATGTYTLSAVLTDSLGRQSTSSQSLTIAAANASVPAPSAALLTPLANRNLLAGTSLTLTFAAASAPTTTLAQVSLYADGTLVAAFDGQGNPIGAVAATGHPSARPTRRDAAAASAGPSGTIFQTPYQLPGFDSLVNLVAVALDAAGQTTVSDVASVHATLSSDVPPQALLSGLASGAQVAVGSTNALTLSASATAATAATASAAGTAGARRTEDGSSALVQLEYVLGQIAQTLGATPPYTVNFEPATAGKYVLHAVATDASGLATISAPIVVEADEAVVTAVGAGDGLAEAGGENGKVFIERTGSTTSALTVDYKVQGSAKAGVDYQALTGEATIPAGATRVKVKIKPLDNPTADGTRVAKLKLKASPTGTYTLGSPAVAKIKIIAND